MGVGCGGCLEENQVPGQSGIKDQMQGLLFFFLSCLYATVLPTFPGTCEIKACCGCGRGPTSMPPFSWPTRRKCCSCPVSAASLHFHYFRLHSQGQFHCRTIRVNTLTPTCVLDSVQGGKVQTQRLLSRDTDEPMAWESCRPGRLLAGDPCTSSAKLLMTSDFLGTRPSLELCVTSH